MNQCNNEGEAIRHAWADYEAAERLRWEAEQDPCRLVRILDCWYRPALGQVVAVAQRANGERASFIVPQGFDFRRHDVILEFVQRLEVATPEELAQMSYGPLLVPTDFDPNPGAVNYVDDPPTMLSRLATRLRSCISPCLTTSHR